MKYFSCLIIIGLLVSHPLHSQQKPLAVGITYTAFGQSSPIRFQQLTGGSSIESRGMQRGGISVLKSINNHLELETGIDIAKHQLAAIPHFHPGMDMTPKPFDLTVVSVPVTARVNFLKYLFVNGGLMLSVPTKMQADMDNQLGIGAIGGIGAKYDFKNGLSAFVNPYTNIHALLPFDSERYHQRLIEQGVRLGLMYRLQRVND